MTTSTPDRLQQAKKMLDKAKIQLMSKPDSAFFTTVCFNMLHKFDESIPTACTNGKEIRFNPAFLLKQDKEQALGLLIHETLHVAFLHMLRLGDRHPRKWNWAADYVINLIITDRGFKLPEGALLDEQYRGMGVEQVYDLLPDPPENQNQHDDLEEPGDGSPGDVQEAQEGIDDILVRAALQSRMQGDKPGTIPGDIQIHLDKLLNPVLPWHQILRRHMHALAKTDYTWRRPNRRYFASGYYLPSMYGEALDHIAVAVDASGSVSDEEFSRFVNETHAILKHLKPKCITLIQFTTEIRSVHEIRTAEELMKVDFRGRGGTNVTPVLEWAVEKKPQCLLVFTDGHFRQPEAKPKTPVVWLIHDNEGFKSDFGRVIHYTVPS